MADISEVADAAARDIVEHSKLYGIAPRILVIPHAKRLADRFYGETYESAESLIMYLVECVEDY